jgi:uncharacterized protein YjbJ (UPF0337 family)
MPNSDIVKGKLRAIKGRVKEALAEAAADDKAADEGRVDQAAGQGREQVGRIKERFARSSPISEGVKGGVVELERRRKKR